MKPSLRRRLLNHLARLFGLHPDVGGLISGAVRLANPHQAALPSENLPMASRVLANGLWNYAFFQFYPHFSAPFWVQRQYDLFDPAYLPRGGMMVSVNVTNRNWMGVRAPGGAAFAIVDTAGSLSPVAGYYSLEFGLRIGEELFLAPRKGDFEVEQRLVRGLPAPRTRYSRKNFAADWTVVGSSENPDLILNSIRYRYRGDEPAHIVIGFRPFNPEGAAPIYRLQYTPAHSSAGGEGGVLAVNGQNEISFLNSPERLHFSHLENGDAYFAGLATLDVKCPFGVGTAAFHFPLSKKGELVFLTRTYERELISQSDADLLNTLFVNAAAEDRRSPPRLKYVRDKAKKKIKNIQTATLFDPGRNLQLKPSAISNGVDRSLRKWKQSVERGAAFHCARDLWNEAARGLKGHLLQLQTGREVTPGAFTYRMFFFRDAAYMLSALMAWNYLDESRSVIEHYPQRIDRNGFFRSQEGEWDSNGQAIWTMFRFFEFTQDARFLREALSSMTRGSEWILEKRRTGYEGRLLPAGFSAEHLGPADYYYWDNFWSLAGLRDTVRAAEALNGSATAGRFREEYEAYRQDVQAVAARDFQRVGALSAAPGRPLDAGMIGNLSLLYPLELDLFTPDETERTFDAIYEKFCPEDLFLQQIIHAGYNIYLSVQLAQCYLRIGRVDRCRKILKAVLKSRTSVWTYPEAIHPRTGGGCMGDAYHGWAFAEILLLLRELTVRRIGETLDVFGGMRPADLVDTNLEFGPFPIEGGCRISIAGRVEERRGELEIHLPGAATSGLRLLDVHLESVRPGQTRVSAEGVHANVLEKGVLRLNDISETMRIRYES